MELSVTFETNHVHMQELWLHMLDSFLSLDPDSIPEPAWINPVVVSTLTAFSPYQEECKAHLLQAIAAVIKEDATPYGDALYLLPKAIMRYYTHTGTLLVPTQMLDAFCAAYAVTNVSSSLAFGAYLDVKRLRTLYGGMHDPLEISFTLQEYKAKQHINRDGVAVDCEGNPLLSDNIHSVYFNFVSDDFRQEVGRYIALSSFDVSTPDKHMLYESLASLEEYDALFAAIIENGRAGDRIEELAAFIWAVIGGLCGVSFEALSRGRYQATPHTPFGMTYTLLIPYQRGVMVFSCGDREYEDF